MMPIKQAKPAMTTSRPRPQLAHTVPTAKPAAQRQAFRGQSDAVQLGGGQGRASTLGLESPMRALAPAAPQPSASDLAAMLQELQAEIVELLEALEALLLALEPLSQAPDAALPGAESSGCCNEPYAPESDWDDHGPAMPPSAGVPTPPPSAPTTGPGPGNHQGPKPIEAGPTPAPQPTPGPGSAPTVGPGPSPNAAGNVGPFGQDASKYKLTLNEEFDTFNTNLWNDAIWYEQSNPTKNYTVEDGKLKIWPQKDASGKFFNRTIDTDGKFYQQYGYFEMEAKLPKGKGVWPAFWLLNHDQPHPHRPEIDIMEAYPGGGPNSGWGDAELNPTAFAGTVWPTGPDSGGSHHKTLQNLPNLSEGFHKYAAKWEPGKITFYFDGKEYYSVNADMNDRMYVLLDLWFGSASGQPDDSTPQGKDNAFEVNYVRAWQFDDKPE